ncbi:RNA polymerase subunit sigma-70, partial [Hymenobacter sp. BT188]|uniref:RNA polymerase sigma factor n=1 Tax=Hymenobacter sp. BT188 TaxID=2763504 RepID=UPI0019BC80F1
SVFTWALRLCRNLALDELRSRRAHQARQTRPLAGCLAAPPATPGFAPEHVGLRELVAQLPPVQRQVLELLYFEGYTHAEVAGALQVPLGTVGTRSRAALRALRQAAGPGA